jgi:eukaryotic-like serine/threonine-protein kinase
MLAADTFLQERYRIVRQLGQGGMGAVYEAVDERLDTIVALKETLFTDERLRKQFEREARLLARMHHPALPRVSDHFNEADGQFLVMQFIPGEDLGELLTQKNGPFSQEEVLPWADQLCDALDYLHTQDPQIIHRDIKPQNLKLTARGQIVLLDFGLAKGSVGQMSVVTTSASIFGYTPNYAPLEQIQGLGTDSRSDIYALAATIFHLMTNVKPPDALSRASALVNGLPDPLPLANEVSSHVSPSVAAVLNKGMSQKRDDRFATATAMRDALQLAASQPMDAAAATVLMGNAATGGANGTVTSEAPTRVAGDQTTPFGSEARTMIADDATSVRKPVSGLETATLVRKPAGGNNSKRWLGALLLLGLVAGGAGAYYAYRSRQTPQVAEKPTQQPVEVNQSAPAQPSNPTQANSAPVDSPKPGESKTEKRVDTSQRVTTKQTAEKTESKSSKDQSNTLSPSTTHDTDRENDRGRNNPGPPPQGPPPEKPPYDPSRSQQDRRSPHPPGNGGQMPEVRTLPNGTRIVTQPDGTRIITGPKGRVQVIPPDDRNRRKRP